jgi:nucleoside-diphosphate-sugar epimerase
VRPPLIYGPGDHGRTYGPSGFCAAAREGSIITLWGDGTELREFLFIDDFCAILHRLTFGEFSGVLNLASGKSHRFVDIIEYLKQQFPNSLNINRRERSKQKVDNAFKPALLRSLLPEGFTFTPLADGIIKTLRTSP